MLPGTELGAIVIFQEGRRVLVRVGWRRECRGWLRVSTAQAWAFQSPGSVPNALCRSVGNSPSQSLHLAG